MYGNHYGNDAPRPGEMRRLMFRSIGFGAMFTGFCGVAIQSNSAVGYIIGAVGITLFLLGLER
jgi:hypothetical protein